MRHGQFGYDNADDDRHDDDHDDDDCSGHSGIQYAGAKGEPGCRGDSAKAASTTTSRLPPSLPSPEPEPPSPQPEREHVDFGRAGIVVKFVGKHAWYILAQPLFCSSISL